MKRYMKAWLGISLLLAILSSCAPAKTEQATVTTSDFSDRAVTVTHETENPVLASERAQIMAAQEPYYVPQAEWAGLETRAYPELDAMAGAYIAAHPNGNPDYPDTDDANAFMSRVTTTTDRLHYSLTVDNEIKVTLSFLTSEDSRSSYEKVSVGRQLNLDRWNGASWERMLYYSSDLDSGAAKGPDALYVGKTLEKSFRLRSVITKLTPGTYRLIAYVNTNPVYAEFELTE